MSKKLNLNKFINKVLNEMVEIVGLDPENKSVDVDLYNYGNVDATVKYKDDFTAVKSSNIKTHIPVITNRKLEDMLFGNYGSDIGSFLNNPNYAKFDQMNSIKIGIMSYLLKAMGVIDKDITSTNVNVSSIEDGKLSADRKQLEHWKEVFSAYYKSLGEICGNNLNTLISWQNKFNDYTLYYKTPNSLLQIMTALGLKKQNAPSGYDAKTSIEYIKGGDKRWVNKWEDSHVFRNYIANGVLQPNKVVNGVDFRGSLAEALSGITESTTMNGRPINEDVESSVVEVPDATSTTTTQVAPQAPSHTKKTIPQQNIIPNNTTTSVASNKVDYVFNSLEFAINVMKLSPVEFYWFFKNATGILSILEDGNFRKHFESPLNTVSSLLSLVLDGVTQRETRLTKSSVLKGTILKRLNGKIEKIDEQLTKSDEIKAAATEKRKKSNKENSNGERGGTATAFKTGIKQLLSDVYATHDNIDTTSFFEYLRQKGIVDSLREAYKDEKGQTLITNDFFDVDATPTIAAFFDRFNSKELVECALTNLHSNNERKKKSSSPVSFAKSVIRSKVGLIGSRISGGHKGIFKSNLETIEVFANRLISQANKTFALVRFLRTLSKGAEQWFNSENSRGSKLIGSLIGEISNQTKQIDAEAVRKREIKTRNEQIAKGERAGKILDISNMLSYGQSIKNLRANIKRLSTEYVGSQMLSSEDFENDIESLSYEKLHNDIGQLLTATNSLTKNAMKLKRLWEQAFDAMGNELGLDDVYFVAVRFKDIFDNINEESNIKPSKLINAKQLMRDAEEAFSLASGDVPLSKMAKNSYLASQKMAHKDESFVQNVDIEDYETFEDEDSDGVQNKNKNTKLTPIQRYILNALTIQRTKLFFDNVQGYCGKNFDALREMTIYNTKFPLVITRFFVGVEGFEQFEGIENFEDYSYGDDEWKSLAKKYKKTGQALEMLFKTFARIVNTKYPSIEMKSTISDESKSNAFLNIEMRSINGNLYQFDLKYPGIPVGESPTMLYTASDYENYIACKFQNKKNVNELIDAISEEYKKTIIPTDNSQRTIFLPSGKKQAIKVDTFFCNIAEKYEDEVIDSKNQKEHTQKHGRLK